MLNTTIRNKALAALALASTLGFASGAQAQDPRYLAFWSSIGSAGTISAGSTSAKTMKATLTPGSTGTLIARYPVAPSMEFASETGVLHLVANMADPGAGASVSVSLIEVPVARPGEKSISKASRQLLTVKSTDDALGALVNSCVTDGGSVHFDFEANVYYVEAVLNWDAAAQPQAPQLRAIQLAAYNFNMCEE